MNQQKGFAHTALIIGLIVALVGPLGVVYWKNASSSDSEGTTQAPESTVETPELRTASIDDAFARKISLEYPESWTLESVGGGPTTEGESTTQTLTIASPSGRYEVEAQVGANGGLGGYCDPTTDKGKIQYIERQEMRNYPEGIFAEVITDVPDGYVYSAGVYQNTDEVQNVKVGDSKCSIYLRDVIQLSPEQDLKLLYARINLKEIDQEAGSVPVDRLEFITDEFDSNEYKDAVEILRSMKVDG